MTVTEASKLKRGDRVAMTRDPDPWTVSQVYVWSRREVEVLIARGTSELRLHSSLALRSLKHWKEPR